MIDVPSLLVVSSWAPILSPGGANNNLQWLVVAQKLNTIPLLTQPRKLNESNPFYQKLVLKILPPQSYGVIILEPHA